MQILYSITDRVVFVDFCWLYLWTLLDIHWTWKPGSNAVVLPSWIPHPYRCYGICVSVSWLCPVWWNGGGTTCNGGTCQCVLASWILQFSVSGSHCLWSFAHPRREVCRLSRSPLWKLCLVFSCSGGLRTCLGLLSHSHSGHMCHLHIIATTWACLLPFQWPVPQRTLCICWLQWGKVGILWRLRLSVDRTFLHTGSMSLSGKTRLALRYCSHWVLFVCLVWYLDPNIELLMIGITSSTGTFVINDLTSKLTRSVVSSTLSLLIISAKWLDFFTNDDEFPGETSLARYLALSYVREPIVLTIGRRGTSSLCTFGVPYMYGEDECDGFSRLYIMSSISPCRLISRSISPSRLSTLCRVSFHFSVCIFIEDGHHFSVIIFCIQDNCCIPLVS